MRWKSHVRFGGRAGETHHESRAGRSGPTPTHRAMSVASFIALERTGISVLHTTCCRWLEVSESWFYKWHDREPTARQRAPRRARQRR